MRKFVFIILAVSLAVAGGLSYFASSRPDGLERVAENHGFAEKAQAPAHPVLPGYTVPGVKGFLSNSLAGIIGVLATFGLTLLATHFARRKKMKPQMNTGEKRIQEPGVRSREKSQKPV